MTTNREAFAGHCCQADPECEHSLLDDRELAAHLDAPIVGPPATDHDDHGPILWTRKSGDRLVTAGTVDMVRPGRETTAFEDGCVRVISASVAYSTTASAERQDGNHANRHTEMLWFSPHCINPADATPSLFDHLGEAS